MAHEQLKLDNQLCFPLYAVSRLITRNYQPFLDELGITYPQYLVLLVLWEHDGLTVNEISKRLILNTNTTTPLLKRLEGLGIITRKRSGEDERKVLIELTGKGRKMESVAAAIPQKMSVGLLPEGISESDLVDLRERLSLILNHLTDMEQGA
ncbi:MAG: MarR family transcriptional regulator [Bacteroidales bacterium]|jgi:DNA-binding MarR family transcriptional regulator|nr:MarR family transcriptional regulator [Bacteroidales bacterium]